jgi:nucleotide-binding universal stress UspA family protein
MFKNILVPTDGSELSRKAIRRAVRLAKEQKARVTGFYVGPVWTPHGSSESSIAGFVTPVQHENMVRSTAQGHLAVVQKAARAAGVPCKCLHVMGSYPYEEIVKAARRNRCDLIVMASHGRRGISRLILGSETSKVLAHTTVPVLVER